MRIALLSLFFVTLSCTHPKKLPAPPTAQALLKAASAVSASLQSVSGEAKVDYFDQKAGSAGRIKGKSLFLVERPNRMRFDVLTPFDQPIVVLVADGVQFSLLQLQDKVFFHGTPTPENIARLFQLPFRDEEIVSALLGESPLLTDPEREEVTGDAKRGEWVLSRYKGSVVQTLRFDVKTSRLQSAAILENGVVTNRISYRNYQPIEENTTVSLPREIFFEKPAEKSDLKIRLIGDLTINAPVDASVFALEAPAGIEVIELP